MSHIYFRCVPFDKNLVTLALESGVDGLIVPAEHAALVGSLARSDIWADEDVHFIELNSKSDEEDALARMKKGEKVVLAKGWEIIPIENLLAQSDCVFAETDSLDKAILAGGILERGVSGIVVPVECAAELKNIVAKCRVAQKHENLTSAIITNIRPVGLGHRVCLDTLSILKKGQGMLVGNSSAFTFLVHAETEHNEYVAARPFRVNAGAVHAYTRLPDDKTSYLGELKSGDELLVVDANGDTAIAVLGRTKTEIRPMLLIEAEAVDDNGKRYSGAIFLQNAETIRLTSPAGVPLSVVSLKPGDEVLCRLDQPGRHFGMRVQEEIKEE